MRSLCLLMMVIAACVVAPDAAVTVAVSQEGAKGEETRFYVTGAVRNPGQYQSPGTVSVRQALTVAGGVTDKAAIARSTITRTVDGKKVTVPAKLDDMLRADDTLFVPERRF
jgi:polysaccharide export outer membrane protein